MSAVQASPAAAAAGDSDEPLTAAQRARVERQRARAKALREARLVERLLDKSEVIAAGARAAAAREVDSGGGFLLAGVAGEAAAPRRAPPPPAPPAAPHERPRCADCGTLFDTSYLMDTFEHPVCDDCRDDEDAHALLTRTEAKSQFLLQDCDLDARGGGPLRCVRRRNPHRAAAAPMRLYLRAQVLARAHDAWGGAEGLAAELARRAERRDKARAGKYARELRALRMTVRGSLYARQAPHHEHRWAAEAYDEANDEYSRVCLDCGHSETYEKM